MASFNYLDKLSVDAAQTVEYQIHSITVNGLNPTLILSPATEANGPYFNELLKKASKAATAIRTGTMSASILKENRDEDRELYPKHIIKGWNDMIDGETGDPVKFSKVEAVNFLAALPDWLFDDIRNYCGNPSNFTETMDVRVQGKN